MEHKLVENADEYMICQTRWIQCTLVGLVGEWNS